MKAMEAETLTRMGSWQLAFEPEYGHLQEEQVYAGYIFRVGDAHNERIDIPNEEHARRIITLLDERDALLAERKG